MHKMFGQRLKSLSEE